MGLVSNPGTQTRSAAIAFIICTYIHTLHTYIVELHKDPACGGLICTALVQVFSRENNVSSSKLKQAWTRYCTYICIPALLRRHTQSHGRSLLHHSLNSSSMVPSSSLYIATGLVRCKELSSGSDLQGNTERAFFFNPVSTSTVHIYVL